MACGGASDSNKKESADDIVESAVKSNVMAHYGVSYDIKNCIVNVTTIKETGDNEYEVYGKANIIDNYGDKWEASFDGKCTVNGEKGRAHNMNYGEPKKQSKILGKYKWFKRHTQNSLNVPESSPLNAVGFILCSHNAIMDFIT